MWDGETSLTLCFSIKVGRHLWDEASSHIYSSYYLECIRRDVIYDTVRDLVIDR